MIRHSAGFTWHQRYGLYDPVIPITFGQAYTPVHSPVSALLQTGKPVLTSEHPAAERSPNPSTSLMGEEFIIFTSTSPPPSSHLELHICTGVQKESE